MLAVDLDREINRLKNCCRDRPATRWVPLPVEGSELRSCLIDSSGKRGTVYLVTVEHSPLHLPLSHHVVFGSLDGIEQRFLQLDDVSVGLILLPIEGTRVRLVEAQVDFWLKGEDPTEYLAPPTSGQLWELDAAFDARLRFEIMGSASR